LIDAPHTLLVGYSCSIPMEKCEAYGKVTTSSSQHEFEAEYEVIDDDHDPYELVT